MLAWLRGRAGLLAAVVTAATAGGALGPRLAPPPVATTAHVAPGGLVADANPDGGGTDNTAAIQGAIDVALASGRPVRLPPGRYAIYSTLRLDPAINLTFGGSPAGRGGPDDVNRGTVLLWNGPAGGTMLRLAGIKCRLHDLMLASARSTAVGVCVDVESPVDHPRMSSQHLFENVACYGLVGPVAVGWQVGADQKTNNEFHWWRSCCTRHCAYAGIHVPSGTFQCKNFVAEDCTFAGPGPDSGCYGVVFASGSMDFWRCNFDSLGCAVAWFGGAHEPCNFVGCTGETNRRFLQATGVACVNVTGCRLSLNGAPNPQVRGQEFLSGGPNWTIRGCTFEEADNQNGFIRPGDGGTVCIDSCQFHCDTPLSTDQQTTWRGSFRNVRVSQGNNLIPEGPAYQRYVPNLLGAGNGLVLWDGHYPVPATYAGGTPAFGKGTGRLYLDSGKLWLSVDGGPAQQVQFVTPP